MKRNILFMLMAFFCAPIFAQTDKPNILLINIDDMGWRDVGFMGSKFYETPVIDSLVKEGMIFANAYVAASNCAPSRASMLTGRWTPIHKIYTVANSDRGKSEDRKLIPIKNTETLDPSLPTLQKALQQNGYTTCIAGKWHLSDNPLQYGFDVNIGGSHAGNPGSYYPPYKNVKLDGPNDKYLTDLIMDKTIEFVKNTSSKKPFFLYYATYAVHTPIQKVDSLMYKFTNKAEDKGQKNAAYATMVNNEDKNIGRLLSTLKEKGVLNNTLIIFTSDNGGLNPITFQHPLRAGKGSYFEGGIRVPMAFVWKGKIKAGTWSNVPVTNMDFFPTLLDVVHSSQKIKLDGNSIYNYLLTGKEDKVLMNRPLYWYFPIYLEGGNKETNDVKFRTRPGEVVRVGDWKLHHYFEDNSFQLYNLKDDVGEKKDISKQNPGKVKELFKILQKLDRENNAPPVTQLNENYKGRNY